MAPTYEIADVQPGFLMGPLLSAFTCRTVTLLGGVLMVLGLLGAALTHDPQLLFLFFSIVTGMGMGLHCLPPSVLIQNYFDKNRALAAGIAVSGGSTGVIVYPPLVHYLFEEYSWRGTLLIVTGILLNSIPCSLLLRPLQQNGPSKKSKSEISRMKKFKVQLRAAADFSVLKTIAPWVTFLYFFFSYMGIAAFYTFITIKSTYLGFSPIQASLLISLHGFLETAGRVIFGAAGNLKCLDRRWLYLTAMLVCGATNIISGFSTSYEGLAACSVVLGLNIGAFVGLGSTVVTDLVGRELLPKVMGFSFLAGGLGNMASLPLLVFSLQETGNQSVPFYLAGSFQIMAALIFMAYYVTCFANKNGKPKDQIQEMDTFLTSST